MDKRVIVSTSRSSADVSDIILRKTATSLLLFRPELVDNPGDSAASVRGTFLYQRKTLKGAWESTDAISLASLKGGEGVKIELHAREVLAFFHQVAELYRVHAKEGIPLGTTELVRVDSIVESLTQLPREQLLAYLTANAAVGEELLSSLLAWAARLDRPNVLVPRLVELGPHVLRRLNAAVGLEALKQALAIWDANADRPSSEEFWQQTLTEHSFVLEQVFSWPATIVKGKAYVGGKSVVNTGGNLVDFLLKNYLTNNAALVEIKTPTTRLLGGRYRADVYNVSDELSGSVLQVANYRYNLQRDFFSLVNGLPGGLEAFEPRCVVIIGSTAEVRDDLAKMRALELLRSQSTGVAVITFDELFEKTRRLVDVLESPVD